MAKKKKDKDGDTALMWAAFHGHKDIVDKLINAKGIRVNAKNKDGWTALMMAAKKGHTEIVKMIEGLLQLKEINRQSVQYV